jgi:hypothetical protein
MVEITNSGNSIPRISPAANCTGTPVASKKANIATCNATTQLMDPSPSNNHVMVSGAMIKPIAVAAIISA